MGNTKSRTVTTVRLDNIERGSSEQRRIREELEFLHSKIMHAEDEAERLALEREIERVKRQIKEEQDVGLSIRVRK